jgi:MYXO-CTERM domain-containing protein
LFLLFGRVAPLRQLGEEAMRKLLSPAVFLPCLLLAGRAFAHIQLQSPAARYVQDNNGLKTAPCGSGTRTETVTKLTPGQMLTVTWKESISHAGHFRIALSANESDFVEPTDLGIPNPLPSWDLADGIQDKTGTQTYSQSVQIPNQECPACVLQLIQVMSTGTDGTNTGPFSGVYHACADVSVLASAGDGESADASVDARPDATASDLGSSRDARARDNAAGAPGGTGGSGAGGGGSGGASGAGGAFGGNGSGGTSGTGGSPGAGAGAGGEERGSGGMVGPSGAGGGAGSTAGRGGSSGAPAPSGGSDTSGSGGQNTGTGGTAQNANGGRGGDTGSSPSSPAPAGGCSCSLEAAATTNFPALLALVALALFRGGRRRYR